MEMKIPPPCLDFLHTELLEIGSGSARVRITPTEGMENPFGIVQGGILAGWMDNAAGPALHAAYPDRTFYTVSMTLNFLRPARAGEPVIARATVVKSGRLQAYVEVELMRESDGALIAKGSVTNVFVAPSSETEALGVRD